MNPAQPKSGERLVWHHPMAVVVAFMVAVSVLALVTGGQASPWIGLLYPPLVYAGFLSLRRATLAAAVASLLYVAVALVRPDPSIRAPWEGGAQVVLFFAVALVTGELMRRRDRRQVQLHEAAEEAQSALDIQHMINTAFDIDVTLDLVILKQREVLPADTFAVLLAEGNTLRVRVSSGLPSAAKDIRISISEDDHGWSPADGKPLVLADSRVSGSRLTELDPAAESVLVVPLQSVERMVGLLYFGCHEPNGFSSADIDHAEVFANRMVFPIQRALLEEELRRLAFTDSQTSLFNHRHFQGQLEEEVHRARRYGRTVSIILIDIDGFKQFNDRFGHPAGDRLLRQLSQVLKDNLRTVDIPARYGGEEFVVICPETQRDQAAVLADRLRETIEATEFDLADGMAQHITVSMGVAAFPADAQNKSELIDAADKALYEAKRTGKNKVVVYAPVS